ncbi:hypothetical protein EMIHUDRAFT_257304 [Emiliania huxleyi CCMP1516]|uniref:F-box domain-containing protein n=2 Tax=Emiliania huxleyi TaxID=2903 RepID=A0A0D3IKH2_EMIH1|nr:hypothetical protein EMIHUDRAFT_257304 [Emiliania huxleyi CCMP1516]EOD11757.1 hypothetical protein EMIHUDRAFT_257304 [Emiliania huxleyi CCMP1516]|eukprot:XP_005764186.1 hypothetical protein EMIHUDRAFT_257304 [Emiliania huxleyi CCMP1516]
MSRPDEQNYTSRLPSELSLHVLRRLGPWDLVAACRACAAWDHIARSEGMWRHACDYRWPERSRATPPLRDGDGAPLEMPPWHRAAWPHRLAELSELPRHVKLLRRPRAAAPQPDPVAAS